ncbi:MAG: outer membrane protein assembly factor BamD, partial [Syntrophobacterales bacterium]
MQRFSAVFLFFALLFAIPYVTGNAAAADSSPCYRQFEFAERLFDEKDYERAVTEYKRFIFLFPGNTLSEEAAFMIGRSYFNDERWNESIVSFGLFTEKYKESNRIAEAHYFKGAGERRLKRFEDALVSFN